MNYNGKLKGYKILTLVLIGLYTVFGLIVLLKYESELTLERNMLFIVSSMIVIVVILILSGCFDTWSCPILKVYSFVYFLVPWLLLAGYVISFIFIVNELLYAGLITFICVDLLACMICFLFYIKKYDNEKIEETLRKTLNLLSEDDFRTLSSRHRYYHWWMFVLIALMVGPGRYAVENKIVFVLYAMFILIYVLLSLWQSYKVRYKTPKNFILHIFRDCLIYCVVAAIVIMWNFEVWTIVSLIQFSNEEISAMLLFGMVFFVRQNAYAYYAVENHMILNDLKKSNLPI